MMKNFSDINMSIEVKAGNTLRTVSVQKTFSQKRKWKLHFLKILQSMR